MMRLGWVTIFMMTLIINVFGCTESETPMTEDTRSIYADTDVPNGEAFTRVEILEAPIQSRSGVTHYARLPLRVNGEYRELVGSLSRTERGLMVSFRYTGGDESAEVTILPQVNAYGRLTESQIIETARRSGASESCSIATLWSPDGEPQVERLTYIDQQGGEHRLTYDGEWPLMEYATFFSNRSLLHAENFPLGKELALLLHAEEVGSILDSGSTARIPEEIMALCAAAGGCATAKCAFGGPLNWVCDACAGAALGCTVTILIRVLFF